MAVNRFDQPRNQQEVPLQTINTFVGLPVNDLANVLKAKQKTYDTQAEDIEKTSQNYIATIKAREQDQFMKQKVLKEKFANPVDALIDKYQGDVGNEQFAREYSKVKANFINDENVSAITKAYERHQDVMKKKLAMDDAESYDFHKAWEEESIFNEDGTKRDWEKWSTGKDKLLNKHAKKQEYFNQIQTSGGEWTKIRAALEKDTLDPTMFAIKESGGRLSTEAGLNKIIGDGSKVDVYNRTVSDYANSAEGQQDIKIIRNEKLKENGYTYFDYEQGKVPKELTEKIDQFAVRELYRDLFQVAKEFRYTRTQADISPINLPQVSQGNGGGGGSLDVAGLNPTGITTSQIEDNVTVPELPSWDKNSSGNIYKDIEANWRINPKDNKGTLNTTNIGLYAHVVPLNNDGTPNPNTKNPTLDKLAMGMLQAKGYQLKTAPTAGGTQIVNQKGEPVDAATITKLSKEVETAYNDYRQHLTRRDLFKIELPKEVVADHVKTLTSGFPQLVFDANIDGKNVPLKGSQALLLGLGRKVSEVLEYDEEQANAEVQKLIGNGDGKFKSHSALVDAVLNDKSVGKIVGHDKQYSGATVAALGDTEVYIRSGLESGKAKGVTMETHKMMEQTENRLSVYDDKVPTDFVLKGQNTKTTSYLPTASGKAVPNKGTFAIQDMPRILGDMYDYDYDNRGVDARTPNEQVVKYEMRKVADVDSNNKTKVKFEMRPVLPVYVNANGEPLVKDGVPYKDGTEVEFAFMPIDKTGKIDITAFQENEGWENMQTHKERLSRLAHGVNTRADDKVSVGGLSIGEVPTSQFTVEYEAKKKSNKTLNK